MIVVSDSTPLIALARIGRLNILEALYGELQIPEAVFEELVDPHKPRAGSKEIAAAKWIKVRKTPKPAEADFPFLHAGEAEAIQLALQNPVALLLMDEDDGRREAARRGLRITGTIGTLLAAKERGLIPTIKPELESLRQNGFHLSSAVLQMILESAGEK
jgi:uncharacterized protein